VAHPPRGWPELRLESFAARASSLCRQTVRNASVASASWRRVLPSPTLVWAICWSWRSGTLLVERPRVPFPASPLGSRPPAHLRTSSSLPSFIFLCLLTQSLAHHRASLERPLVALSCALFSPANAAVIPCCSISRYRPYAFGLCVPVFARCSVPTPLPPRHPPTHASGPPYILQPRRARPFFYIPLRRSQSPASRPGRSSSSGGLADRSPSGRRRVVLPPPPTPARRLPRRRRADSAPLQLPGVSSRDL